MNDHHRKSHLLQPRPFNLKGALKHFDLDNLSKDTNHDELPFVNYYESNLFKPRIKMRDTA